MSETRGVPHSPRVSRSRLETCGGDGNPLRVETMRECAGERPETDSAHIDSAAGRLCLRAPRRIIEVNDRRDPWWSTGGDYELVVDADRWLTAVAV
jgi:hypothetical protein